MQALCQAVKVALKKAFKSQSGHITLWLQPKNLINIILLLAPHRDSHLTYDICRGILMYIDNVATNPLTLCSYQRAGLGAPKLKTPKLKAKLITLPTYEQDVTSKQAIWQCIQDDYTFSIHPSAIVCIPPEGNTLPPLP